MQNNYYIRLAAPSDAKEMLAIYTPYVLNTAISFEYQPPTAAEFAGRIEGTLKSYPYLAAVSGKEILGYAYTGAFAKRAAYSLSAETAIYLKESCRDMGLGRMLYQALEQISKAQNILNLYACVALPDEEDEYLTKNSALFHEHLGYSAAGIFRKCGCKFGRWYNVIWMEKSIGEHTAAPLPFIPFPELDRGVLQAAGVRQRA